jgi:hypothetical protein
MDPHLLRTFMTVVDEGSFSAAAERFAAGALAEGVVAAICACLDGLDDEHATLAEPILAGLAEQAGLATTGT